MPEENQSGLGKQVPIRFEQRTWDVIQEVAKASGISASAVVRAAIQLALPNLQESPELARQLDAGVRVDLPISGGLRLPADLEADVKRISAFYGKPESETLVDSVNLGLQAVIARASAYGATFQDGTTVPKEMAEQRIERNHEAHPLWVELMRVAALHRGARQLLARITAHPDGIKAYDEIRAQDEELHKSGVLVRLPMGSHIADELRNVPALKDVTGPIVPGKSPSDTKRGKKSS